MCYVMKMVPIYLQIQHHVSWCQITIKCNNLIEMETQTLLDYGAFASNFLCFTLTISHWNGWLLYHMHMGNDEAYSFLCSKILISR
jgi:hypothetical protein